MSNVALKDKVYNVLKKAERLGRPVSFCRGVSFSSADRAEGAGGQSYPKSKTFKSKRARSKICLNLTGANPAPDKLRQTFVISVDAPALPPSPPAQPGR